jgi:hypothetical protein
MFSPIVRRIIAVALAAPALLVVTAVAAAASEHHTSGTYYDSTCYHATGATANGYGAQTWRVTAAAGSRGHDVLTWYRARTADAGALGAYTSTVGAGTSGSTDHGWRARPDGYAPKTHSATELTTHSGGTHMIDAAYHQSGAQANAWGASTSTVNAVSGDHGHGWGQHGYTWSDQSSASANAWGADASRTTSYAGYGGSSHHSWGHHDWSDNNWNDNNWNDNNSGDDNWGHGNWGHHSWGHHSWDDGGTVGYSSSSAHAGYDGAWAGDSDSAASYD